MPIFLSILSHVMRLKSRITRGNSATVLHIVGKLAVYIFYSHEPLKLGEVKLKNKLKEFYNKNPRVLRPLYYLIN